ncbi:hypothetical protein MNBD_CHLOROFLEXI01-142 [hydrothermal vent metagenome]|uniref:Uncharacterized protein n=1 Tax=hydrothermal vent metagenome TaxID=652676 RepID=A0A3B0VC42_9ZZZZ
MKKNSKILKWSLFAGAIYFLAIAAVHMLGVKVPLLFVYFNVPSYAYQDRIISFLAFGWSAFLFTASRDPVKNVALVKAILLAGVGAIVSLSIINTTTDFKALSPEINVTVFWMETAVLLLYVSWLIFFYFRSQNEA